MAEQPQGAGCLKVYPVTKLVYPVLPAWDTDLQVEDADDTLHRSLANLTRADLELHLRRVLWLGKKQPSLRQAIAEYGHAMGLVNQMEKRFGEAPAIRGLWEWLEDFETTPRDQVELLDRLDAGELVEINADAEE